MCSNLSTIHLSKLEIDFSFAFFKTRYYGFFFMVAFFSFQANAVREYLIDLY